jgi:hypothetical protein
VDVIEIELAVGFSVPLGVDGIGSNACLQDVEHIKYKYYNIYVALISRTCTPTSREPGDSTNKVNPTDILIDLIVESQNEKAIRDSI